MFFYWIEFPWEFTLLKCEEILSLPPSTMPVDVFYEIWIWPPTIPPPIIAVVVWPFDIFVICVDVYRPSYLFILYICAIIFCGFLPASCPDVPSIFFSSFGPLDLLILSLRTLSFEPVPPPLELLPTLWLASLSRDCFLVDPLVPLDILELVLFDESFPLATAWPIYNLLKQSLKYGLLAFWIPPFMLPFIPLVRGFFPLLFELWLFGLWL